MACVFFSYTAWEGWVINILITNNPRCRALSKMFHVEHFDAPAAQILTAARDMVHLGHRLLTHPLVSSLKPSETPYKSVLLTGTANNIDFESVGIIENSIAVYAKFAAASFDLPKQILEDFAEIDYTIIKNTIKEAEF